MKHLIDKDALVAEIKKLNPPFYPTIAEKEAYENAISDCIDTIYNYKTQKHLDNNSLIAEIERLREYEIKWMDRQGFTDYHIGARDAYTKILDSLYQDLKK